MRMTLSALLVTLTVSAAAHAEMKRFAADIDQASWKTSVSPLSCTLSQHIPGFGTAQFSASNGRSNLHFQLRSDYAIPLAEGPVTMRALPASWAAGEAAEELGVAPYFRGNTLVQLKDSQAWRMMTELSLGRFPTFFYSMYNGGHYPATISVSAVRFTEGHETFQRCLRQLLPYTFAEIAKSTLYFEFDRVEFTPSTKNRLNQIRNYLKADPRIELMVIEGHTDSKGGRWFNFELGRKRAEAVRDYLLESGIEAQRVKLDSYGERRPVSSNETEAGQKKNRRVEVTISR